MQINKDKILEIGFYGVAAALIVALSYWLGHKAYSWMPPAATVEAQRVDDLFSFLVWLGSIIFFGITGMIAFALLTCRAERGDFTEGHSIRHNTTIEIIWTVIPTILVVIIVVRSVLIYNLLDIEGLQLLISQRQFPNLIQAALTDTSQAPKAVHTVEVKARQFSWTFHYPEVGVTSTELHLPVNQPVKFSLQTEDVLHGFYVPEFRVKQNLIPGQDIDLFLTPIRQGRYTLHDSQLSGTYFALMSAPVVVESADAYQQWLERTAQSSPTLAENLANQEFTHPNQRLMGHHWPVTVPKAPPLVHVSSSYPS